VARAERDLSQGELARSVGVSRQTISSIETGQYCPSTLLALRLAHALGEPVERLFWLEGEPDA
jgi:putative transcriptional regulator